MKDVIVVCIADDLFGVSRFKECKMAKVNGPPVIQSNQRDKVHVNLWQFLTIKTTYKRKDKFKAYLGFCNYVKAKYNTLSQKKIQDNTSYEWWKAIIFFFLLANNLKYNIIVLVPNTLCVDWLLTKELFTNYWLIEWRSTSWIVKTLFCLNC